MSQALQIFDPEVPLAQQVSAVLAKYGHPNPTAWEAELPPEYATAPADYQRFLINRYWRVKIGQYAENTMDARYCLLDGGLPADWLRLFETGVAACIVRNTLPSTNS